MVDQQEGYFPLMVCFILIALAHIGGIVFSLLNRPYLLQCTISFGILIIVVSLPYLSLTLASTGVIDAFALFLASRVKRRMGVAWFGGTHLRT